MESTAMVERKKKKRRTRKRIVGAASRGLLRTGAEGLSVVNLMKLAGLTHGGFYSHFESRDDLVIEAFALAVDRTLSRWNKLIKDRPVGINAIVDWYMSATHRNTPAQGCALPSLSVDIARSTPKAREVFSIKLQEMIDALAYWLPRVSESERRNVAIAALATMLGSVVLARATADKTLSDNILVAGRRAVRDQTTLRSQGGTGRTTPRPTRLRSS
jgi:TetR/AcrR family transcriptional regulator, transcriptional repressor for nem operon